MKIAVVGSGISGVVSSYLLDREHDVTLYEARERLGGHSHTVDVTLGDTTEPVDTGFIVFNDRNYPHFRAFLDELDVSTVPTEMSFSFRDASSGREYGGHGLGAFFAQKQNLLRKDHWTMLFDVLRFNWTAPKHRSRRSEDVTLKEYLEKHDYSSSFVHDHLIPMVSAIWSVSLETAMSFPFGYVVDFFENHGLLSLWDRPQWRTIVGGSREYLRSFRNSFSGTLRTADPVEALRRNETDVELYSEQNEETYDAVVLATHSDQALDLLDRPSEEERSILGGINYKVNSVLLHTDQSVLPRNRSIWASWNYHRGRGSHSDPTVTYNMNILQDLDFDRPVCVSLNSGDSVDSKMVLDEFSYAHPVYTQDALKSQERKGEICGRGSVYYAGSYWGNGFHEDGAESAVNVVRKLGVEDPL